MAIVVNFNNRTLLLYTKKRGFLTATGIAPDLHRFPFSSRFFLSGNQSAANVMTKLVGKHFSFFQIIKQVGSGDTIINSGGDSFSGFPLIADRVASFIIFNP